MVFKQKFSERTDPEKIFQRIKNKFFQKKYYKKYNKEIF